MAITKLKRMLSHNAFINHWIYKHKNRIHVQSSNLLLAPEEKCRNNSFFITGEKNNLTIANGQAITACKFDINGSSNKVYAGINPFTKEFCGNTFRIYGSDNCIEIDDGVRLTSCSIFIAGNHNYVHISKDCSLVMTGIHMEQDNNSVIINDGCTFHGRDNNQIELILDEATTIMLHRDCMIASGVKMRSSDSHSILDLKGKRLNLANNIMIAEHTWICQSSIILKGFSNGKRTVIAAGSICTKPFQNENVVIGGNPASILKKGIDWDRKQISSVSE